MSEAATETTETTSAATTKARETLEGLVDQKVRVVLRDGRTTVGRLLCVDNHANIVVGDCREHRPLPPCAPSTEPREEVCRVNLAIIARRDVVSVHVLRRPAAPAPALT